jgi:predicted MFS family arabinose efflux permease
VTLPQTRHPAAEPAPPPEPAEGLFYGWAIVAITFFAQFVVMGTVFYSYGILLKPLAEDLGGSRFLIGLGLPALGIVGGIAGPFIGREVDRRSIRGLMILGAAFLAAGFLGLSRATSVWHLYLCFGVLISLGMALLGGIANTALVVNWFARRRGTALGISQIGVSLSGFVMAHVTTWLIEEFGWRTTTAFFGIVPLVLVAPLVWLVVVNRPENLGLFPDGDSRSPDYAGAANPGAETEGWTVRDALRQPAVWIIGLLIGFTFAANGAVIQVTHSHVTDLGFAAAQAATVLSLMAGMAALGKPTFGWLADRTTRRGTMFLCIALQTLGLAGGLGLRARRARPRDGADGAHPAAVPDPGPPPRHLDLRPHRQLPARVRDLPELLRRLGDLAGASQASAEGEDLGEARGAGADELGAPAQPFFSSSSMIVLNAGSGWAPRKKRPLMKKPGVPVTPSLAASAASPSTFFLTSGEPESFLN